jgi:hypothetical protein
VYKVDNVKRLAMTDGGSRGVDSVFGRHDERVGDEYMADVLLWEAAETDGCGSGVVLCVPAPVTISVMDISMMVTYYLSS